jgi:hypothetical protein
MPIAIDTPPDGIIEKQDDSHLEERTFPPLSTFKIPNIPPAAY